VIKEIEIGDLVRMARNPDAYGKRSLLVGLVIDFCEDHKHFLDTPGVCAKVEWTNGVLTVNSLPTLELV